MSTETRAWSTQPAFRLRGRAGDPLVVRLTVASRLVAPAVLRPGLEPWVDPSGQPTAAAVDLAPAYVYLSPGEHARVTLTTRLPAGLDPGTELRGALSFPGVADAPIPLVVEIVAGGALEHYINVTLPLAPYEVTGDPLGPAGTKAIATLLAGLTGMEVIPARWVVAELVLTLAESGFEVAQTTRGAALRARLSRLRFYKNGVLAFRGAHLPSWIMIAVTVSSGLYSALGGKNAQGRLLFTWEKWLLDLIDTDIENFADETPEVLLPRPELDRALARIGNEAEDWFAYLVLGLMEVSPRLRSVLEALAAEAPEPAAHRSSDEREVPDVLSERGSIQR